MKLFENPFGIHEQAVSVRNKRMELIAANIANADTPHFKARDLDFKKILAASDPAPMAATTSVTSRPERQRTLAGLSTECPTTHR